MKCKILKLLFLIVMFTSSLNAYSSVTLWVKIVDKDYIPQIDSSYTGEGVKLTSDIKRYNKILNDFVFIEFRPVDLHPLPESPFINTYSFTFENVDEQNRFRFLLTKYYNDKFTEWSSSYRYKIIEMDSDYFPNDPLYRDENKQEYLNVINTPQAWGIINDISDSLPYLQKVNVGLSEKHFERLADLDYSFWGDSTFNNLCTNDHGTEVLGTLSAKTNNGIGIASTGGLVSKTFGTYLDTTNTHNTLQNIIDLSTPSLGNCKVVNCSWVLSAIDGNRIIDNVLMNYLSHLQTIFELNDCILVASAGNGMDLENNIYSCEQFLYPASLESCLSVSTVGWNRNSSNRNKYGHHKLNNRGLTFQHNNAVDICAPGYDIYTTSPTSTSGYEYVNGTSFSAPIVAGIAAMIRHVNPCLSSRQVVDILKTTANDTIYKIRENQEFKGKLGTGLVDAGAAVKLAKELRTPHIYIRDSQTDSGVEPYLGALINSPDIKVKNTTLGQEINDLSTLNNNAFFDLNIHKIGCEDVDLSNSVLYVGICMNSLFSNFNYDDTHISLNNSVYNFADLTVTMDTLIRSNYCTASNIPFVVPDYNNISIGRYFSANDCHITIPDHVRIGVNVIAAIDEGNNEEYIFNNENSYSLQFLKSKRTVTLKKGRERIMLDKFVHLARLSPSEIPSNLVIRQKYQSDSTVLSDNAEVFFWVSDNLIPYIENVDNLEFVDENRILISNRNIEINFLPTYNPEEDLYLIGLEVHFFGDEEPQHSIYDVDIELVEEGEVSDAITFTAIRDESVYFNAVASISDSEIMSTQETTLSSNRINNNASYTWFDAAMDTIGRGRQLTVQPDRSQTYTLKIQQESNGYVASDTVSVVVKEGRISAITPNPATMLAMISYEVTPNKSASITITDISNTIRQNYPISQANGTLTISVDNMPKGVYYVTLNVEGTVADTKSLIVQ